MVKWGLENGLEASPSEGILSVKTAFFAAKLTHKSYPHFVSILFKQNGDFDLNLFRFLKIHCWMVKILPKASIIND